jgi:hypothetical protein
MREFTASDIRNLLGVFNFIERDELAAEGFGLNAIEGFMRDPVKAFPRLDDRRQDAIADLINRKLWRP